MPGQGSVNNRRTARAEKYPDVPYFEGENAAYFA